ncbi:MAG: hypothetical protein ACTHK1_08435 [Actinomycetales bacterium]
MTAPRWCALLLLAAVFGMHGVQCMGADSPMVAPHAHASGALTPPMPSAHVMGDDSLAAAVAPSAENLLPAGPVMAAGTHEPKQPTGLMDHLWAVCLAVLSAVLAAIALLLLKKRRPSIPAPPMARGHRWWTGLDPPRPPDIYCLCVLRT